ncbi:MAG: hypothetical protein A3I00_02840 [Betaproteobacteria bacterium RIFCSPLOWO2_02_FULL_64_12]|nr:MAG: hypothetical protein A3I00_02840 [Betaproteobacteria bacterium RIFCSPLOWO2_02_FULL_64_12]
MRRAPGAAIARDVLLAVDTSYDHRLRLGDRVTHSRHQGAEHRHIVARGFNHDDGRIQAGEVLPVLEVRVNGEENVKLRFREPELRAVPDPRPSRPCAYGNAKRGGD